MSEDAAYHIEVLYHLVSELQGRLERMIRHGVVAAVDYSDATKPRARIDVGIDDDGEPVLGPWCPVASFAGARLRHEPVAVGQQMTQVAADGDHEQGVLLPLGFSRQIPSPSTDPHAHVDQFGTVTTTLKTAMEKTAVGSKADHTIVDQAQRLTVADISKLVIKIGDTPYQLKMSALEPGQDIQEV